MSDHTAACDEVLLKELDAVSEALGEGVVPSTVVFEGQVRAISVPAILNGAYFFYASQLSRLADRVRVTGRDAGNAVSLRVFWLQKIEMWTLKALEDQHLTGLKGEEHGSPSKA